MNSLKVIIINTILILIIFFSIKLNKTINGVNNNSVNSESIYSIQKEYEKYYKKYN